MKKRTCVCDAKTGTNAPFISYINNYKVMYEKYNNEGFQLEIRQLRSFCVAAALRSISKASTELGIAQPINRSQELRQFYENSTCES
jgi:hypothetical protein